MIAVISEMVLATRLSGTEFAGGFTHGQNCSLGIQTYFGYFRFFVFFLWLIVHFSYTDRYCLNLIYVSISPALAACDEPLGRELRAERLSRVGGD